VPILTINLKPCPFCGGKAYFEEEEKVSGHNSSTKTYFIQCEICKARGSSISDYDAFKQNLSKENIALTLQGRWNIRM
jgi:hypothetical protein